MVGAEEARVAVLLQQQLVYVIGGVVEREAIRVRHHRLRLLHRLAIDVDLARSAGTKKLTGWCGTF